MLLKLTALAVAPLLLAICSDPPAHHAAPQAKVEFTAPPSTSPSPSPTASPSTSPTPLPLPPSVFIHVPYTPQAPHGDWSTHEDYCEAAAILMYTAYLQGDKRDYIPANEADARMTRIVQYEQATFHESHPDLTLQQVGLVAHNLFGYTATVMPATLQSVQREIAAGHPVVVPVMTHGAPGGQKLAPYYGYLNVYHVLLIKGYSGSRLYTNDAGFMIGENYPYDWSWLAPAIDAQTPKMGQGRVMLVLS